MRRWIDVASLIRTKNKDGGFIAKSAINLPFLLSCGTEVAFVPPQTDQPRSGVVCAVTPRDAQNAVVYFDTVNDVSCAQKLVGSHCLVRRSKLPNALLEQPRVAWIGFYVIDEVFGYLGQIICVRENPGQMLLEIERIAHTDTHAPLMHHESITTDAECVAPTDTHAPLLIPLVDAFIKKVDINKRRVFVKIPPGLLELD